MASVKDTQGQGRAFVFGEYEVPLPNHIDGVSPCRRLLRGPVAWEWRPQFLFPGLAFSKSPTAIISSYLKALSSEVPSATYAAFKVD